MEWVAASCAADPSLGRTRSSLPDIAATGEKSSSSFCLLSVFQFVLLHAVCLHQFQPLSIWVCLHQAWLISPFQYVCIQAGSWGGKPQPLWGRSGPGHFSWHRSKLDQHFIELKRNPILFYVNGNKRKVRIQTLNTKRIIYPPMKVFSQEVSTAITCSSIVNP